MSYDKDELKRVAEQLTPQIKRENNKLRLKIANEAMYYAHCPNTPYAVRYDGQTFYSDDTGELVDQVIVWLKKSVEERAKEILDRHYACGYQANTCII